MASLPTSHAKVPEEIVVDADESVQVERQTEGTEEGHDHEVGDTGLATPPLDMDIDKSKISRKREREVSLEPSTPQTTSIDIDSPLSAQRDRDRRAPAKKNRTSAQLDSTAEQDEDGQDVLIVDESDTRSTPPSRSRSSRTPPSEKGDSAAPLPAEVSASPPHETKVRLISRGVKDLNWRSLGGASAKLAFESSGEDVMGGPEKMDDHEDEEPPHSDAAAEQHAVARGRNPPLLDDEQAGADEHNGGAGPAAAAAFPEQPQSGVGQSSSDSSQDSSPIPFPGASASIVNPSPPPSPRSDGSPRVASLLPSALEDDVKSGQKRKLGDRTVSERHVSERKGKRVSPPPAIDETGEPTEKKEVPKSKPSGFMAYASTSSPFASLKGPSVLGSSSSSSSSTHPKSTAVTSWSPTVSSSANSSSPTSSSQFSFTPSASPSKPPPSSITSTPTSNINTSVTTSSVLYPSASTSFTLNTSQIHAPQKRTGFEAFASTSSPFASAAKRPKSPPPAFASSSTSGPSHSGVGLGFGFGHLAKTKRAGSPARPSVFGGGAGSNNAFSAYASTTSPFKGAFSAASSSTPSSSGSSVIGSALDPPAREGSPLNGGVRASVFGTNGDDKEQEEGETLKVSFGERLRSSKDAEDEDSDEGANGPKVELTEQEVTTGEEDEETVFQARGKLFSLSSQNQWKERGTGNLKLSVRRIDSSGARLIMRKEAVYTVLLNAPLFKGMKCFLAQDPRYLRFSVFEGGHTTHYNLRVSNAKIAEELLEEINAHIPTD